MRERGPAAASVAEQRDVPAISAAAEVAPPVVDISLLREECVD